MLGAAGMGVVPQLGAAENAVDIVLLPNGAPPNQPLLPKLGAGALGAEAAAALAAAS